ncbi:MAG TPA: hypothetical protein VL949_01445 [Geobacteraceae bacterium]|nr:hypothetical protein [Geobacteraceae bacterium]
MRKATIATALGLVTILGGVAFGADKITVTGEVVDTYCYSTAGAKGEGHRACGLTCAAKGIPVALLENGTDKLYVLLPKKNATPVPKEVVDKMGRQVTVTGMAYTVGGNQFLTVESFK